MTYDPTDLEGDEKRQAVEAHLSALEAYSEADAFKWIMGDMRGRLFMWGLLQLAGVYEQRFDGTNESAVFSAGERNAGLKILGLLNDHCPEKYALMIREQQDHDRRLEQISNRAR